MTATMLLELGDAVDNLLKITFSIQMYRPKSFFLLIPSAAMMVTSAGSSLSSSSLTLSTTSGGGGSLSTSNSFKRSVRPAVRHHQSGKQPRRNHTISKIEYDCSAYKSVTFAQDKKEVQIPPSLKRRRSLEQISQQNVDRQALF